MVHLVLSLQWVFGSLVDGFYFACVTVGGDRGQVLLGLGLFHFALLDYCSQITLALLISPHKFPVLGVFTSYRSRLRKLLHDLDHVCVGVVSEDFFPSRVHS